jgi:hypothetical protein
LKKVETEDLPKDSRRFRADEPADPGTRALVFSARFRSGRREPVRCGGFRGLAKVTGGKTDDSSLLTIFVCLAADLPPRPALSKAAARALIRKARLDGFKRLPVLAFIRAYAPYEMQDDLEALWTEFFPEAQGILLDAADTTLGDAVDFLRRRTASSSRFWGDPVMPYGIRPLVPRSSPRPRPLL